MDLKCDFCLSSFKDKYTLKNHVNKSKKCIKLRSIKCESCNSLFNSNTDLENHFVICKDYIIKNLKEELVKKNNLNLELNARLIVLDNIRESYERMTKDANSIMSSGIIIKECVVDGIAASMGSCYDAKAKRSPGDDEIFQIDDP